MLFAGLLAAFSLRGAFHLAHKPGIWAGGDERNAAVGCWLIHPRPGFGRAKQQRTLDIAAAAIDKHIGVSDFRKTHQQ